MRRVDEEFCRWVEEEPAWAWVLTLWLAGMVGLVVGFCRMADWGALVR